MYLVTNDQGLCLIRTTDSTIAEFVQQHSSGIDSKLRLTVGGDPGTKVKHAPIWTHVRRFTK
jgi:hypothetical protein